MKTELPSICKGTIVEEVPGSNVFSLRTLLAVTGVIFTAFALKLPLNMFSVPLIAAASFLSAYIAYFFTLSRLFGYSSTATGDATQYLVGVSAEWKGKLARKSRIGMEEFFEAYIAGKVDLKPGVDLLEFMEMRHLFFTFKLTWNHAKFFFTQWIPELLWHSKKQDKEQVRDHYDRGNDFYEAFLGTSMIYTSGIVRNVNQRETLEELQDNKLNLVCDKIRLKATDKLLDIGCGWGTFVNFAAKTFGVKAKGVTLSRNQTELAYERAEKQGIKKNVDFLCMDYRDIPMEKYNKITCLEMAEHVGVRKFPNFMEQVYNMLEDDGIFYLQIAGLRRKWQFEDFVWGLFMAKYVFPGADASCPLNWVINQLESGGFEVQSVDTIGVHYSATIERWYRNWMSNKSKIVQKYGMNWFRKWGIFLSWSTIISRQGSATCYQIVAHKNLNKFDRSSLISPKRLQA